MIRFTAPVSVCVAMAMAVLPLQARGQIMRRPVVARPINWVGVNIGIVQGYEIDDGTTSASWQFGSGIEYAARFEHPLQSGIAVGAQASFAHLPLTYSSSACGSCNANASVTQLLGLLHYGQGYTFHGVYELTAGMVGFSNFRRADGSSTRLGANATDYDFKFSLGYGIGFGLSPSSSIEVVEELGTILHQRDGLAGGSSNYPRVYVTRIGGKVSF